MVKRYLPPFLLAWLVMAWLHQKGWLGGQVYWQEDVAAVFCTLKQRLYLLFHGQESWSWWDRLPQLGIPRLSNVQVGWLSPFSLLFGVLPGSLSWRWYPLVIDSTLLLCAYFFLCAAGARPPSAAWGSLMWVCSSCILNLTQNPCYKESLVATALMLGCALRVWQQPCRPAFWLGLAGAGALHAVAGSPTAFFYDHACLAAILPALAWKFRPPTRVLLLSAGTYLAGLLLASLPWWAVTDFLAHGHRNLEEVNVAAFSDQFRRAPSEIALAMLGESLLGGAPPRQYGMGYPLLSEFSLVVTVLALWAGCQKGNRALLLVALLLTLQMLGESGGLLWLLHQIAPKTTQIRAPDRFFLVTALIWSYLAALGLDSLPGPLPRRLALAWSLLFTLGTRTAMCWSSYAPAEVLQLPSPLRPPEPVAHARVAVLRRARPPLNWESGPITMGIPTLVIPEALFEQGYLLGLAYSQWGPEARQKLARAAQSSTTVPLLHPEAPLLASWGLTWVLDGDGQGSYGWRRLQPDPPRFWLARPRLEDPRQWAQRTDWKPFEEAQVDPGVLSPSENISPGSILIELDQPDQQILRVEGGGLLVGADQWDPGWRCQVDGQDLPVVRANSALKACLLPQGNHRVVWQYRARWWPRYWTSALAGSLLLTGCLLLGPRFSANPPAAQKPTSKTGDSSEVPS